VDEAVLAFVPGVQGDQFDHIPELDETSRLLTKQGLRLQVYLNG